MPTKEEKTMKEEGREDLRKSMLKLRDAIENFIDSMDMESAEKKAEKRGKEKPEDKEKK